MDAQKLDNEHLIFQLQNLEQENKQIEEDYQEEVEHVNQCRDELEKTLETYI